jgi:hypothetical protein
VTFAISIKNHTFSVGDVLMELNVASFTGTATLTHTNKSSMPTKIRPICCITDKELVHTKHEFQFDLRADLLVPKCRVVEGFACEKLWDGVYISPVCTYPSSQESCEGRAMRARFVGLFLRLVWVLDG